jgi:isocitrate/isopropylmalate dehydrogenase
MTHSSSFALITLTAFANPIAQILSSALMLRHSFDLNEAAAVIESVVGARTRWMMRLRRWCEGCRCGFSDA